MVVQFFKGGRTKQGAKSAIAYLLNERLEQGTAKIYEGNPDLTLKIISQINRKWKFTSGVISFEEPYEKISSLLPDIVKEFEETFFTGLSKEQYNVLYVLHTDKGRAELHFVVPRTELTTGKDLSIYTHKKDLKKKDLFQQYINLKYGLSNPLDKERQETLKIEDRKWSNDNKELKKQIHQFVEEAIQKGLIGNREEVISFLQEAGFTIKRKGKDYISIKTDDMKRAIRLKGAFYGESFTSIEELGEEYSSPRATDSRNLQEEIRRIREELERRMARDAEANRKKYSLPKQENIRTDRGEFRRIETENMSLLGNRGNDRRDNIDNNSIKNKNDDSRRIEDDSIRTEAIGRVRAIGKTKQSIIDDFKKLIPRTKSINSKEYEGTTNDNKQNKRATRDNLSTTKEDRPIDRKLDEINQRIGRIGQKIRKLKEAIMNKIRDNREELELFKTQINIADVAQDMGYEIDKKKSSRKSIVLKAGGDVVIVSRNNSNGHYIYFNANNPADAGTIIDFIQNRTNKNLGQIRRILRQYLQSCNRIEHLEVSNKEYIKSYYDTINKFSKMWEKLDNEELKREAAILAGGAREISKNTLLKTNYISYDEENGKIVFPVFAESGICGFYKTDTSFREKRFEKGSLKGIWADKKFHKGITKIVVTETPVDSLSLKEMGLDDENTLHIATLGRMGQEAKNTLQKIFKYTKNAELLIATDNDKAGQEIENDIVNIAKSVDFKGEIEKLTFGKYKDANELLLAKREKERANSIHNSHKIHR